MAERLLSLRLEDIIEAIERLCATLNGVAIEAFELDWETRWLVERGIEIISEASNNGLGVGGARDGRTCVGNNGF